MACRHVCRHQSVIPEFHVDFVGRTVRYVRDVSLAFDVVIDPELTEWQATDRGQVSPLNRFT